MMFDKGILALTLVVIAKATSGGALDPAPLPECWISDNTIFLTKLKAHIKSTNKEGILDCRGKDGFVDEICQYNENFEAGETDVITEWNECGIISFTCLNRELPDEITYVPGPLPAEVKDLDLNNGHVNMLGIVTCMPNTLVYFIAAVIGIAILALAIALIYCIIRIIQCICRRKKSSLPVFSLQSPVFRTAENRSGQEAGEELMPVKPHVETRVDVSVETRAHEDTNVELITTGDFMSRFCGLLDVSREVQKAATCIAKKASDLDIAAGHSPISVAAAAIYMASQASVDKKSQREIADVAGVADVTIRQSYKLLLPRASELFPADFKFATPVSHLPQN